MKTTKTVALKTGGAVVEVRLPRTMTAEQYRARFAAEHAALRRYYCSVFAFWKACRHKPCRKARACAGDALACLKRGAPGVPRETQWRARRRLLDAMPKTIGAPERHARQFLPEGLCE